MEGKEITIRQSQHLKAIAILMMVCLHLFNRDYHGLYEPLIFIGRHPFTYYISLFCDACVPIFAFVSGYGLYYKYRENSRFYFKSNIKRIKNLYINYWIIVLIFPVLLGFILKNPDYPGTFSKFVVNFLGIDNSYNGAWWFFTTYIIFALTSSFWYKFLDTANVYILMFLLFVIYLIAFYLRVYKVASSDDILSWFHRQGSYFFCTLLQFMIGGVALKYNWQKKISIKLKRYRYKNITAIVLIIALVVFHYFVPSFIIAPFTGVAFIYLFLQLDVNEKINRFLDFMAVHSTNIWLIHMFFYMIFFPSFIYSFKYPLIIYLVLITICILSSYVINYFYNFIIRLLKP